LASSQASTSVCTKPSPQLALTQVAEARVVSSLLPSSHASPGCSLPSPQLAGAQLLPHSSSSAWLASSHSSPGPTKPSPQLAFLAALDAGIGVVERCRRRSPRPAGLRRGARVTVAAENQAKTPRHRTTIKRNHRSTSN
jgi:hypothetical protein